MRSETAVGARLSFMMFLQFFVWGAWYVSMTGYMAERGLGGLIGWAYTVGPIAAIISPFFLGMIADRCFATERTLGVMHLLGGAALLAVPGVVAAMPDAPLTFTHPYILLLLAHMLCYMPTLGLSNSVAFHRLPNRERQFPLVRVFGTVGWIAGNIAVSGNLIPWGIQGAVWIAEGDKSPVQFYIAGGAAVLLGLYSFTLPHVPPPARGKKVRARDVLGLDALRLLADRNYAVFLLCSFLICIPLAAYYAYARLFVAQSGFENPTLTMSYGQMSEIVFMVLMPLFFLRLGFRWMLLAGMLAWVVRYGLFAGAAGGAEGMAAMIVLGILLHGICYDFFFVTGFIYTDRKATPEIRSQAQGLLVLVTQGLGLGVGAQVMGAVVARYTVGDVIDWRSVWIIPCVAAAAVAVVFWSLFREDRRPAISGGGSAA
jgi:nucleoside transporter